MTHILLTLLETLYRYLILYVDYKLYLFNDIEDIFCTIEVSITLILNSRKYKQVKAKQ